LLIGRSSSFSVSASRRALACVNASAFHSRMNSCGSVTASSRFRRSRAADSSVAGSSPAAAGRSRSPRGRQGAPGSRDAPEAREARGRTDLLGPGVRLRRRDRRSARPTDHLGHLRATGPRRRAPPDYAARRETLVCHGRARAGVDVLYVSELLGHSSPSITRSVYQHVRTERLEAAVQAVSDAIGV
jgi:hypothetical protein